MQVTNESVHSRQRGTAKHSCLGQEHDILLVLLTGETTNIHNSSLLKLNITSIVAKKKVSLSLDYSLMVTIHWTSNLLQIL